MQFEATESQCFALAQLVKRIGWRDVRQLAIDKTEARLMLQAAEALRAGLADVGFSPR